MVSFFDITNKLYLVLKENEIFGEKNRGFIDSEFVKTCHEHVVRFYLKNMSMGSTVNFVEFKQCPTPTTSYAELSKDMNLINLKKLWIRYGFSEAYEIMAGQFDGLGPGLQQLKIINSQGVQSFNSLAFKGQLIS